MILPWRDLRAPAGVLVACALLLMGAGLIVATHVQAGTDQLLAAAMTARQRAATANGVLMSLTEAESAQRGFLLSRDPEDLRPFHGVLDKLDERLDTLHVLAADSPSLMLEMDRLAVAVDAKADALRHVVEVAGMGGIEAALEIARRNDGGRMMDQVRSSVSAIAGYSEAERNVRATEIQLRQERIANALVGGLSFALLLLVAAGVLLWLYTVRLRGAQDDVRRQQAALDAAVEHVPNGVAVFDAGGVLTLANVRFAPTLGLPPDMGRPGTSLAAVAGAAGLHPPLRGQERPSRPGSSEAVLGTRTLDVWRSPLPDGGQMLAVADITRRVEAEAVARHAQKMEILGQMTGGVAHDFNNLLQIVSANLELVRARVSRAAEPDQRTLSRLDAAASGVARGARLTRHLLAFARRQQLAPETLDAAEVLGGMEDMLRRTLGGAVVLDMVAQPGLWPMSADRVQLESALLNLALNARDAMTRDGGVATGHLLIEAANRTLDDSFPAGPDEALAGDYVSFAVSDTGSGMDAATIGRALEPFFTTKPEGQGTGLGLPMALGFAKQSGGHLQIYSEPGLGTTVRLFIPRSNIPATRESEPVAGAPHGAGELVLLVEDDAETRQAAAEALQGLGYRVAEAESGDDALRLLQGGLRPRGLFTDVVMPGRVDARSLAARGRALVPELGVLFTSGYTEGAAVRAGLVEPGASLLSKPWRMDELARAMRDALGAPLASTGPGPRPPEP